MLSNRRLILQRRSQARWKAAAETMYRALNSKEAVDLPMRLFAIAFVSAASFRRFDDIQRVVDEFASGEMEPNALVADALRVNGKAFSAIRANEITAAVREFEEFVLPVPPEPMPAVIPAHGYIASPHAVRDVINTFVQGIGDELSDSDLSCVANRLVAVC